MTEERIGGFLRLAGAAAMLLFCLAPFSYMALVALAESPDALALAPTASHFREILEVESLHFLDYLRNSLIVSAASAILAVATAALAAYAVVRLSLPGGRALLLFVLALSMFPQVSMIGYLFKVMTRLGWINSYPALILPYLAWTLPLALWILAGYFSQIPKDLDRAALVDGCSPLQVLTRVLLPVAAPGIFSALLLAFIFAFNEFMFALMLTVDHRSRTIPVGIALFQGLHGETPWGRVMAAATLTTLPVVCLTLLFQRRIVRGLTRGAVKG